MTPKHLEGGAEGRTGWPGNSQPQREEAPRPHPRSLKNKKFKGPRPSNADSVAPRPPAPPHTRAGSQARKFKTSQTAQWGTEATSRAPRLGFAPPWGRGDAKQPSATPGPPAPTVGPPAERQAAGLVKESSSEPVKGLLRRGALGGEPDPSDTGWGTSLGCPGRRHQGAPAAGPGAQAQPGKARSPSAET